MSPLCLIMSMFLTRSTLSLDWHLTGQNIALGKPAEHYKGTLINSQAGKAVDGKTLYPESCSHTVANLHDISYWTVYLRGWFILKGVRIYTRTPTYGRFQRFKIIGGDYAGTMLYDDDKAITKLYNDTIISIPINSTSPYRELTVLVPAYTGEDGPDGGHTYMNLCEVQIFASMQGCVRTSQETLTWIIRNSNENYNETYNLVSVGAVIDFQCQYFNFKLSHTSSIRCLEDGSFDGIFPTCTEIICHIPTAPNGGKYVHRHKNKYTRGDIISMQCLDGYIPRHLQSRECLDTSTWDGSELKCTLIKCAYPTSFINGTLLFIDGTIFSERFAIGGEIFNITCDEGHIRQSTSALCTYYGTWNQTPQCTLIVCDHLGDLHGGFYIYSNENIEGTKTYAYGTLARINCLSQLYKKGGENSTLVCSQSGQWTGNSVECSVDEEHSQRRIAVIVGASAGSVAGLACLVVLVVFVCRKRIINTERNTEVMDESNQSDKADYTTLYTVPRGNVDESNYSTLYMGPRSSVDEATYTNLKL